MSTCSQTIIYTNKFEQVSEIITPTIIILSVCIPVQIMCLIGYYCCRVKKKTLTRNQSEYRMKQLLASYNRNKQRQRERPLDRNQPGVEFNPDDNGIKKKRQVSLQNEQLQQQQPIVDSNAIQRMFPSVCSIRNQQYAITGLSLALCLILLITAIVAAILFILAIVQSFSYALPHSECILSNIVTDFINGTDQWLGLQYFPANLTFLDLSLHTRIEPSKNSIRSLLLNGTVASNPIGFPNNTAIYIVNSETDATKNTVVTTSNANTYVDSALRQWLYRNSSLSNTNFKFPVCQNTIIALLPHPIPQFNALGQTVQLDYMTNICGNLTQEVDRLVNNSAAVDTLLTQLITTQQQITSISANISQYNDTVNQYALRSSEYENQLGSINQNYALQLGINVTVFILAFIIVIVIVVYVGILIGKGYKEKKLRNVLREYQFLVENKRRRYGNQRNYRREKFMKIQEDIDINGPYFRNNQIENLQEFQPIKRKKNKHKGAENIRIYDLTEDENIKYKPNRQQIQKQNQVRDQIVERNQIDSNQNNIEDKKKIQQLFELSETNRSAYSENSQDEYYRFKKITRKLKKISQNKTVLLPSLTTFFKVLIFCFCTNLLIGLSQIINTYEIQQIKQVCLYFQNSLQSSTAFTGTVQDFAGSAYLSTTQKQLLTPIQSCTQQILTASSIPTSNILAPHFLSTSPSRTIQQLQLIQQLYRISALYNETIPSNIFQTESLIQIQILKSYLLQMETMPIKSLQDFNITTVLQDLNLYANGSSIAINGSNISPQIQQCGQAILQDQYVYNVADCLYPLIDYITEATVTDPRCIQIPTYDGSSGTANSDLNNAQHTIVLNGTCTTVLQVFNSSNVNCFLSKRAQVLINAGCTNVALQYTSRVQKLLEFSLAAGSYTNSYLQNLRNFFGVYAVINSNLTDFFANTNTSSIINPIGWAANNTINNTLCSWISIEAAKIYDSYCGSNNTFKTLYYDAYVWLWVVWLAVWMAIIGLIFMDNGIRMVLTLQSDHDEQNEQKNKGNQKKVKYYSSEVAEQRFNIKQSAKKLASSARHNSHRLQQSQQTLRDQDQDENKKINNVFNQIMEEQEAAPYKDTQKIEEELIIQKEKDYQRSREEVLSEEEVDANNQQISHQFSKEMYRIDHKTLQSQVRNQSSQANKEESIQKVQKIEKIQEQPIEKEKEEAKKLSNIKLENSQKKRQMHLKKGRPRSEIVKQYEYHSKKNTGKHSQASLIGQLNKQHGGNFFRTHTNGTQIDDGNQIKTQSFQYAETENKIKNVNKVAKTKKQSDRLKVLELGEIIDNAVDLLTIQSHKDYTNNSKP